MSHQEQLGIFQGGWRAEVLLGTWMEELGIPISLEEGGALLWDSAWSEGVSWDPGWRERVFPGP